MSKPRILIVEDDKEYAKKLVAALEGLFAVEVCSSEAEFHDRFTLGQYDLLMMDMRLNTDREGLRLLKETLTRDPLQATIVMTAYADTETYADAITSGAITYLDKQSFSPSLIARTVESVVAQGMLRRRLAAAENQLVSEHQEMIGFSSSIKAVSDQLRQAAEDSDVPVLVIGELGSGRQLAARTLHRWSRRRSTGPFVVGAYNSLVSVKPSVALFGDVQITKGNILQDSRGWLDDAKGGILYLNGLDCLGTEDIAEVAKLIETRRFRRVGGGGRLETNVQIVVALRAADTASAPEPILRAFTGQRGVEIRIPPLRERNEDIPLIAQYTLQQFHRFGWTQVRSFRGKALAALESFAWPGNVRELRIAIEYAAIRADADAGYEIGPEHLPLAAINGPMISTAVPDAFDYKIHLARAELGLVESAIEQFETSKKVWLAERLRYNDRYTFSRRIRRIFSIHPHLRKEFSITAALFAEEEVGDD